MKNTEIASSLTNEKPMSKIVELLAVFFCDCYKMSHVHQYPEGTTSVYSVFVARNNRYAQKDNLNLFDNKLADKISGYNKDNINYNVIFGVQYFIKKYLVNYFQDNFFNLPEDEVIEQYKNFMQNVFGGEFDIEHIRKLHKLQYLPIRIKSYNEGERIAVGVPFLTIENTLPEFFWVTNFLETLISCNLWFTITSATTASIYYDIVTKFAKETCDDLSHIPYQCHDFSMRGMSSIESATLSGMAHLLFFKGTDTAIAPIELTKYYSNTDGESQLHEIASAVPSTEHSVMCSYGQDEFKTFDTLLNIYPEGIVSVVSDTYNFWNIITNVLPSLKSKIMSRNGKLVIRPDSGDPVKILCGDIEATTEHERKGLIECLWDMFGGYVNEKGYKVLDSHIGAIYGDSITTERAYEILTEMKEKGFASSNVVFGVGSYTYQFVTRDTYSFAIKATQVIINGEIKNIEKNPVTDPAKKSLHGRVSVIDSTTFVQGLDVVDDSKDKLKEVFINGVITNEITCNELRQEAQNYSNSHIA